MVTGIYINPINPIGSVDMCIVFFRIITELGVRDFFDKVSMKEKYRFSFDKNWVRGIAAKNGSWFSILSNTPFEIFSGKWNVCTVLCSKYFGFFEPIW